MPMTDDAILFQSIVDAVNVEAFAMTGTRSTCALASHALAHVLGRLGYLVYPLRVEVAVHHRTDRTFCGTLLGRDPWGRQAAEPGAWHGHLVVVVEMEWLLDPTLDQANKPEWGAHHVRPLAVPLPGSFWNDPRGHVVEVGELDVRYCPYRRPQSGFVHAGEAPVAV